MRPCSYTEAWNPRDRSALWYFFFLQTCTNRSRRLDVGFADVQAGLSEGPPSLESCAVLDTAFLQLPEFPRLAISLICCILRELPGKKGRETAWDLTWLWKQELGIRH